MVIAARFALMSFGAVLLFVLLLESTSAETLGYGAKQEDWRGEVIRLSWSPRAFHIKGLLTDEECEHIKQLAADKLEASDVVDTETGQSKRSQVRTSTGTFFDKGYDDVIRRIEQRVAMLTMLPVQNQEGLQVLKYVDGQKYEPHHDYFLDSWNKRPENGGQRVATVLMYLATPEEGGETVFPNVDPAMRVTGPGWSECALQGLAHKPVKGDALFFYSLTPDGSEDEHSLHGSCPTTKGEKWSATFWIHVDEYGQDAEYMIYKWKGCVDLHQHCGYWADTGECDRNTDYMHLYCKLSCKLCDVNTGAAAEEDDDEQGAAADEDGSALPEAAAAA